MFRKNKKENKVDFFNLHMIKDGKEKIEKVDQYYLMWFVASAKDLDFDECYAEKI